MALGLPKDISSTKDKQFQVMTVNMLKIKQLTSSATSQFSKQMVSMPVKTDYNT